VGVFELGEKKRVAWPSSVRELEEMMADLRAREKAEQKALNSPSGAVIDEMFRLAKGLSGSVCPCDNLPCKRGAEFIRDCSDIIYFVFGGREIDEGSRCERAVFRFE